MIQLTEKFSFEATVKDMEEIYNGTLKDQRTNAKLRQSCHERCKQISKQLEEYDQLETIDKAEWTPNQEGFS